MRLGASQLFGPHGPHAQGIDLGDRLSPRHQRGSSRRRPHPPLRLQGRPHPQLAAAGGEEGDAGPGVGDQYLAFAGAVRGQAQDGVQRSIEERGMDAQGAALLRGWREHDAAEHRGGPARIAAQLDETAEAGP